MGWCGHSRETVGGSSVGSHSPESVWLETLSNMEGTLLLMVYNGLTLYLESRNRSLLKSPGPLFTIQSSCVASSWIKDLSTIWPPWVSLKWFMIRKNLGLASDKRDSEILLIVISFSGTKHFPVKWVGFSWVFDIPQWPIEFLIVAAGSWKNRIITVSSDCNSFPLCRLEKHGGGFSSQTLNRAGDHFLPQLIWESAKMATKSPQLKIRIYGGDSWPQSLSNFCKGICFSACKIEKEDICIMRKFWEMCFHMECNLNLV